MKRLILMTFSGLIFIMTSCTSNSNMQPSKTKTNLDLLALFEDINGDNLHVWAKSDKTNGDKFQGKQIDTIYFPLFGNYMDSYKQYYTDPKTNITKYSGYYLFASYKFTIDNSFTGLILRVPSQYEESAIDLWIYDIKNDKLIKSVELADGFGDENWYFNKESWIRKTNDGLIIINRKIEHEINETTLVDSIISDRFEFNKILSNKIVKLDTIEINKDDFKLLNEK